MIYMKESYVYTLPADMDDPEGPTRWVACHSGNCGYERTADDSSYMIRMKPVLLRMFKVNGQQTCAGCIKESIAEMQAWIGEEE
jgi:hypothetical protein